MRLLDLVPDLHRGVGDGGVAVLPQVVPHHWSWFRRRRSLVELQSRRWLLECWLISWYEQFWKESWAGARVVLVDLLCWDFVNQTLNLMWMVMVLW